MKKIKREWVVNGRLIRLPIDGSVEVNCFHFPSRAIARLMRLWDKRHPWFIIKTYRGYPLAVRTTLSGGVKAGCTTIPASTAKAIIAALRAIHNKK